MSSVITAEVLRGMGAIPHAKGVAFRVWAPHADAVYITGTFNEWSPEGQLMVNEGKGYWYADIANAKVGSEYRYRVVNGDRTMMRIDPYARQVTSSVGNAVVHDPQFDWQGDNFHLPPINELVIYEMHLGTFNVNLSHNLHQDYRLGFPASGTWRVRFNSDWRGYSASFANTTCNDVLANCVQLITTNPDIYQQRDGFRHEGLINIGPYSVLILSQDKS